LGDFKNLEVWKKSKNLAVDIYKMTENGKFKKDFNLKDQIRRSAVSIPSNIAEGDERLTNKESIRFFYIANGSIAELITQLIISNEIGYISDSECKRYVNELENISKMIKSLIKYRSGYV